MTIQSITPSSTAYTSEGNQELVDILKKYGNNPKRWPALHYATHCQDEHAIEVLLENGADPNEMAPFAIDARNNPTQFHTPLYIATPWDFRNPDILKPSIVKLLLDYGADPCIFEDNTTLVAKIINLYTSSLQMTEVSIKINERCIEILNMFADKKIDFNKFCYKDPSIYPAQITPLRLAVHRKDQDDYLIKFLLDHGATLIGV